MQKSPSQSKSKIDQENEYDRSVDFIRHDNERNSHLHVSDHIFNEFDSDSHDRQDNEVNK